METNNINRQKAIRHYVGAAGAAISINGDKLMILKRKGNVGFTRSSLLARHDSSAHYVGEKGCYVSLANSKVACCFSVLPSARFLQISE